MKQIAPAELARWLADADRDQPLLLDVRENGEFETCRIQQSRLMPMNQVPARIGEIGTARDIVVICHHGVRSMHVAQYLGAQGFERVHNLQGGIDAWARSVDPAMPVY